MLATKLYEKILEKAGITINGSKPYDIQVHDERLFNKMCLNPSLAAGEGYMDGWWDCEQLDELFNRICRTHQDQYFQSYWAKAFQGASNLLFNLQSRDRSKEVAEKHYNLGNELYSRMLGKTMAYTCAYWKNADNLDQAQENKLDLVCRKLNLKPGEKLLELGCGWGSFAKYAAENYGVEVTAVNISTEQVKYAQDINRGLPVKIVLADYRDSNVYNSEKIQFDKVASIGLCEHVGHKNYHQFLSIARNNMKENGLFLLHTIGANETQAFVDPWINKYIFPNGMLPSIQLLSKAMEKTFILEDLHNFGADYDKTLMAWHRNFIQNWPEISHNYDERFFRLWNYYLLSCAGGFRSRSMQLWQIVLSPNGMVGGYQSVR